MAGSRRDNFGQWAAANGGGGSLPESALTSGARTTLAVPDLALPDPVGSTSGVLQSRMTQPPPGKGGMRAPAAPQAAVPDPQGDVDNALRAMGYGPNETAGQHQIQTPEGPASHGADIPGDGVPEAGEAGEGAAAGGEGLGELALLAL